MAEADQDENNPFSFKTFVKTKIVEPTPAKSEPRTKEKYSNHKKQRSSARKNDISTEELPFPDVVSTPEPEAELNVCRTIASTVTSTKSDGGNKEQTTNPFSFKNFVSKEKDVASKKKRVLKIIGDEVHEIKPLTSKQGKEDNDDSQYLFGFTPPGSGSESDTDSEDKHNSSRHRSPLAGSVNYFVAPAESSQSQLLLIEELNQLKEDNERLKKELEESTNSRDYERKKVTVLQKKLTMIEKREADETAALENMVQMVERNLELTTQRAVRAEASVSKLKEEIKTLKTDSVPMTTYQQLFDTHHCTLNAIKEKSRSAADEMATTARRAEKALRELYAGVETLRFVSSQLNYIDRITEVPMKQPEKS